MRLFTRLRVENGYYVGKEVVIQVICMYHSTTSNALSVTVSFEH